MARAWSCELAVTTYLAFLGAGAFFLPLFDAVKSFLKVFDFLNCFGPSDLHWDGTPLPDMARAAREAESGRLRAVVGGTNAEAEASTAKRRSARMAINH